MEDAVKIVIKEGVRRLLPRETSHHPQLLLLPWRRDAQTETSDSAKVPVFRRLGIV
jgi:hypothetical protein